MSRAGWLVVAACASAPPPPLANKVAVAPGCDHSQLAGTIVDAKTNEPIAGVTLIASNRAEQVAQGISNEAGKFTLQQIPADALLTLYYADLTIRGNLPGACAAVTIVVDTAAQGGDVYPLVLR